MNPSLGSIRLAAPNQHQIEYSSDLFIPVSGKRSGAPIIINLAWLFALTQHSSWVLFEHLAWGFKNRQVREAVE